MGKKPHLETIKTIVFQSWVAGHRNKAQDINDELELRTQTYCSMLYRPLSEAIICRLSPQGSLHIHGAIAFRSDMCHI